MPFKSEKQRRYLWANEPEIAKDWTDTYGSKIHAADGGIMRIGLANGGEATVFTIPDYGHGKGSFTGTLPNFRKFLNDEEYEEFMGDESEVEGILDADDIELQEIIQSTGEQSNDGQSNQPFRVSNRANIPSGLISLKDWTADKLGIGIDLGRTAMRGIGNFIKPGLGFALGMLPRDTAAQKFNRSFTVGGTNMREDPYGYYNQLRHGNLNQDPFGRNPVSMFGNYMGTLAKDANYIGTNKFNLDKKDFAQDFFDKNAVNAGGVTVDNTVYSGPDYQGGDRGNNNAGGASLSGGMTTGQHAAFRAARGGIANLWPR